MISIDKKIEEIRIAKLLRDKFSSINGYKMIIDGIIKYLKSILQENLDLKYLSMSIRRVYNNQYIIDLFLPAGIEDAFYYSEFM